MTVNLAALIFDMDGVVADTLSLHFRAWSRLAQEEGIPFTAEQYRLMQGLHRTHSFRIFIGDRQVSEETASAMMRRKNSYFLELLSALSPADRKPGVLELIHEARLAGMKIGLGSSSQNVRRVLDRLDLMAVFDVLADGNTVPHPKPSPDIFLWVAGQLGVEPVETIVFEDSEAGVQAARAGGFWTVGVGSDAPGAHIALASLADLTLDDLHAQLETVAGRG